MGLLNKIKQTLWVLQFAVLAESEDHIVATKKFTEGHKEFVLTIDADTNGVYLFLTSDNRILREVPIKLIKTHDEFTRTLHRALGYISNYS